MMASNNPKLTAPSVVPSQALRARVLASVEKTPAATPGSWSRRVGWVAVGVAMWMVGLLQALGPRRDWVELPVSYSFGTLVLLVAASAALTWLGTSRGATMVGAPVLWLLRTCSLLPLGLLLWCWLMNASGPSSLLLTTPAAALTAQLRCHAVTVGLAVPILAAWMWLRRGLVSASPHWTGACLGMAAATWAHVVLHRHCEIAGPWHSVFGHLLPMLPLALLGAWWEARRVTRLP